ncbi:MAG TPA: SDR family NAD(P)-dependent oxidoreductase [Steroidobacteraceae bacterium]|jgi:NAD(P)-dependent dehydrogenase (short-subunit alcohol dehydrogenase family)
MKIAGKVAVVTGGASGIGQAVVRAIVAKGAKAAIFDLNESAGVAMEKELGSSVIYAGANVAEEAGVAAAIAKTMSAFGAIHICVNCAGIGNAHKTFGKDGPFPMAAWNKVITVNLTGTFNVTRLCAEQMAKNVPEDANGGRGVVINTASVAAFEGQMGQAAYSASKGGIVGMTLPMARDLAGIGVRVNTIAPGLIETPLFKGMPPEVMDALSKSVLYPKRLGRPEEIAHLAICIIENDYINGETIRCDGGIRMQPR